MNFLQEYARGFGLPLDGFSLMRKEPRLRTFVLIPILINAILFIAGMTALWIYRVDVVELIWSYPAESIVRIVLWYLVAVLVMGGAMVLSYFLFTPIGCLIASPFNDALAGRTEQVLDPDSNQAEVSVSFKEIANTIKKELGKVLLASVVFLIAIVVNLLPAIGQVISIVVTLLLGGWVMSLEYLDYPMSRHGYTLAEIRRTVRENQALCLGFGGGVIVLLMIPLLNLVCIPACVVAGTDLFVRLRKQNRITPPVNVAAK